MQMIAGGFKFEEDISSTHFINVVSKTFCSGRVAAVTIATGSLGSRPASIRVELI